MAEDDHAESTGPNFIILVSAADVDFSILSASDVTKRVVETRISGLVPGGVGFEA